MPAPLVSVVIPTYNQPSYLLETLDSVFAQTFGDYEVIVVNDGSTDDTAERLRAYVDLNAGAIAGRLRIVAQANGGIGVARNSGLDEARGRYVALLDHDDLWLPGKLAAQVEYFARHPECSVVSVPWAYSTDPARPTFVWSAVAGGGDGLVDRPLAMAMSHPLITSAIMFDRAKAAGLRYVTRRQAIEDQPFHFGLFARGQVGVAGDEILMIYRWHQTNSSREALYWSNGQRQLRELDAAGVFADLEPQRADLLTFLAHFGRTAAAHQLCSGRRRDGWSTFAAEFPHQVRDRAFKFLLTYPLLAVAPRWAIERVWPQDRHRDGCLTGKA